MFVSMSEFPLKNFPYNNNDSEGDDDKIGNIYCLLYVEYCARHFMYIISFKKYFHHSLFKYGEPEALRRDPPRLCRYYPSVSSQALGSKSQNFLGMI